MKKEPDWEKLRDVSRKLTEAQTAPDYEAIYERLIVEAREACHDYPRTMEALSRFGPVDGKAPAPLFQQRLEQLEREKLDQTVPAA